MPEINSVTSNSSNAFIPGIPASEEQPSPPALLRTVTTPDGIKISGEAQYLFDMTIYLQNLDQDEQEKAVEFLAKSDDPLNAKALESFNAYKTSGITDEVKRSITEQSKAAAAKAFKPIARDPALGPEIAVIPNGTAIYRLDGKTNYYPNQMGTDNAKLRAQLDELETHPPSNLNIQENANLFGTVRNALLTSENVLQSFDDVLNFNYTLEKAQVTINQTNVPNDIKSKLNDILDQSIKYQDSKQTRYVEGIQKYTTDVRVGAEVRENIRSANAAQAYNNQLQTVLNATNLSVLNAGPIMTKLLSQHTDLIRFSPAKINDALLFYKQDLDTYQDFVKNGYRPSEEKRIEFDTTPLTEGHNYALKVIEEIQHYTPQNKVNIKDKDE